MLRTMESSTHTPHAYFLILTVAQTSAESLHMLSNIPAVTLTCGSYQHQEDLVQFDSRVLLALNADNVYHEPGQ